MDPKLAQLFELGRNAYAFPHARILAGSLGGLGSPAYFSPGVLGTFNYLPNQITDLALDWYHHSLLRSTVPNIHLGCASVVYWGFITYGDTFAQKRARRYIAGNPDPKRVAAILRQATLCCAAQQWGAALAALRPLRQLGQLPFGSKIIAFLDPDHAGVYDNRINRYLAHTGLDKPLLNGDSALARNSKCLMRYASVSRKANQQTYQSWCRSLRGLSDSLNASTPPSTWSCTEPTAQPWRAIDVERAIFSFAQPAQLPDACGGHSPTFTEAEEFARRLKAHCD